MYAVNQSRPRCDETVRNCKQASSMKRQSKRAYRLRCSWNDHGSDVVSGIANRIERGVDLPSVQIHKAQRALREGEFPIARELHQQRQFGRQVIGHPDDLDFLVDDLSIWKN